MRDPSVETKYFCSSTNSTCELTNDTPATASAASFNFIRKAILLSSGTSNGSRLNALVHDVTTLSAWARTTLRDASAAFARAIATASSAAARAAAGSTRLVAAKPHAPLTSTRTPRPRLVDRDTLWTWRSRVAIDSRR